MKCTPHRLLVLVTASVGGVLGLLTAPPALRAEAPPRPPAARQVEHISVWHGERVNDQYCSARILLGRRQSNPEGVMVPRPAGRSGA
jgi:hypothetical protein